jgi:hypothetical protein
MPAPREQGDRRAPAPRERPPSAAATTGHQSTASPPPLPHPTITAPHATACSALPRARRRCAAVVPAAEAPPHRQAGTPRTESAPRRSTHSGDARFRLPLRSLPPLVHLVINDGEQTTTSKGIKPQETRDLPWKTPSTREGITTGASQQQFTMSGVRLQRQRRRLTRRELINLQWTTLTSIYDPYGPPLRSVRSRPFSWETEFRS